MIALLIHRPWTGSSASQSQCRRVESQDNANGPDDPLEPYDADRTAAPMAMVGRIMSTKMRGAAGRASGNPDALVRSRGVETPHGVGHTDGLLVDDISASPL